jgi:DUF177 domain-containing protein
MKILLTDSVAKKSSCTIEESIQLSGTDPVLKAEIVAKFLVSQPEKDVFSLDGSMKAAVVTACDRCGNRINLNVDQSFFYQLRLEDEPQMASEYDCTDEDCEIVYLSEPVIESSDVLKEQLLLALPVYCLCGEKCKGLCDHCGVNLNEKQCKCKEINENSPFAILKNLQKN